MKTAIWAAGAILTIAASVTAVEPKLHDSPPPPPGFPKFKWQEIASDFKIGYAVHICDVDGDGKPDIVVVDKDRVVWYENPTWKMRTITKGKAKPDNVCICSLDIDGDGKLDFVLGAGWKPMDTKTPGTLQWLRRGKTLDKEWEMFPIPCDEPTVHRVAAGGLIKSSRPQFTMAPLMGRDSTKARDYLDGEAVRILGYTIPDKPTEINEWQPTVINNECHVVHNLYYWQIFDFPVFSLAAHEGIRNVILDPFKPQLPIKSEGIRRDENNKDTSWSDNAGEISVFFNKNARTTQYATVEPWHGNTIVTYVKGDEKTYKRIVLDRDLRWGHAIKIVEFKTNEIMIIAGVRDNPDPKQGDKFTEKRGVRLYRATDAKGEKWERYILEDGGVAVEDLQVADLNGDGKPDIVAVGRATGNCRIYWNQGK